MTKKTETTPVEKKEVVAPVERRLIGQKGVIAIGGKILEPIAQFDKTNGPLSHNGVLLVDYNFSLIGDKAAKLSLYSYTVRKDGNAEAVDLFILADELSSLDMEVPEYLDFQDQSFAVLTLVNSSSRNDYLRGGVVLVNVATTENAFQDSIIQMQGRGWGESHEVMRTDPLSRRITVNNVDANKLKLQGRQLPPGIYHDADLFENTFIRGELEDDERLVTISNSTIRWSSFREGDITITNSMVSHTGFHFTGDVKLHGVTVESENFGHLPSIYLNSKFDMTAIDVAGKSQAKMIRINQDRVMITLPLSEDKYGTPGHTLCTMSFRNPRSRRGLRNQANDVLFGDDMPSEMEESVLDYFVDTVLSRCSMMNLVDSAKRLLSGNLLGVKEPRAPRPPREMGPMQLAQSGPTGAFFSPGRMDERGFAESAGDLYGTSTALANEYDKTIYIDKVTKF
jgi:hypothetical protein